MNKLLLALSLIFYISGCAPTNIPRAIIPEAPKQTESALPNVKKTKINVDETIIGSNKIGSKIDENKQTVFEQRISIIESLSQAQKIKEKTLANIAVTELDAINLINEIKKVEDRNLFLETQNLDLFNLRYDQAKILMVIKETLDKTEDQVIFKDEEVRQLREQHSYLSHNLDIKNNESENLKKLLSKEKEVSASAKVYRNIIWIISGVWLLWTVAKNILLIYFPTSKFRI